LSVTGSALISYATATISNGYNVSEDTLIYQGEAGIHPVFNNETGQLLLLSFPAGSTAESSEIQTALRSVFYRNKNTDNPQSNQRVISFAAYNQNDEVSNTISRSVTVQNVNDAPRLRSPSNAPVVVNSLVSSVPITSDLEVLDVDDAFLTGASVNITRGRFDQFDQLVFTDNSNDNILIQRVEGSNRRLVLTGRDTKENYQVALRSIGIQNLFTAQGFKGNREVVMQITDENSEVSNQFGQYIYVLSRTNPNNVPPSTQDISVSITENQTLNFETQQFQLVYTDPEQVQFDTIRILSLPEHGFLSLDGVEIDAEYLTRDRGVVRREDINKLTYVPNQDYLGLDQFEWSTDDGINPPANNSIVSISINEAPVPFSLQIPE
ncbi:MAG: Ig-like domain-containing protein, partial [Bacteroidota bacterium]